jgi:hypothetical protein
MSKLLEKIAVIAVTLLIWMMAVNSRAIHQEQKGRAPAAARQAKAAEPRTGISVIPERPASIFSVPSPRTDAS